MLLTKHSRKLNNLLLIFIVLIATIGLIDSAYLTITHYTNTLVPCNFTHGCETVLRSSYSEIFGIPVAALGIVFYFVSLTAGVFFVHNKTYHWWLSVWGVIGFFSTVYLIYIQAFILHAYCQYCLLSALTSTSIAILGGVLYLTNKHKGEKQ